MLCRACLAPQGFPDRAREPFQSPFLGPVGFRILLLEPVEPALQAAEDLPMHPISFPGYRLLRDRAFSFLS